MFNWSLRCICKQLCKWMESCTCVIRHTVNSLWLQVDRSYKMLLDLTQWRTSPDAYGNSLIQLLPIPFQLSIEQAFDPSAVTNKGEKFVSTGEMLRL